jgi:hypothetical protein
MMFRNPFANPRSEGVRLDGSDVQQSQRQDQNTNNQNKQIKTGGGDSINDPQNLNADDLNNQDNPIDKNKDGDDSLPNLDSMWEDEPEDPDNPRKEEPTTFLPPMDGKKLGEILGRLDFTKSIKPETWTKIKAGGDDAVGALQEVLNGTLRQALAVGFNASSRLVETGLSSAKDRFTGSIPDHVKDIMVENSLTESNPFMTDPVFAPTVKLIRERIQNRFPKATPKQVETAVNSYFDKMYERGTEVRKTKQTQQAPDNRQKLRSGDAGADFEAWLNEEVNARTSAQV